ncbi:ammonium transporter [Thermoflavimicrobium dichotomicum]|uniref:Ammonium transporter n=1 Tax=Thermoflavimicrobium dichotomicum TaxID=46223 RepID=A0A1I3UR39_9BACL|nr:ammonium transporter [Thermoflavimicrobium dichotomicum]SFJ84237.1 ammonium transporter, Amt family [Thermoflavimicrobium dichotomicum]
MKVADVSLAVDAVFILMCAVFVFFMQAGFVLLEAGSTRMKNAGHIAVKQVISISIAALAFWVAGYGLTFGDGIWIGTNGWFLNIPQEAGALPVEISYLYQLSFLAASLAIVWGGFAERAKLGVYILFGLLYSILIYPVIGHWIWGADGWLHALGKQDFAGSTVVHLQGGVAALVATMLLKPRIGRFSSDGTSNTMPGHNQVYTVLGVLLIWLGWFGFNPGSTLTAKEGFFGYIALTTNLAAGAGAVAALGLSVWLTRKANISMILNGMLAALVAITAACAFVETWAAVVIGAVAGVLAVLSMYYLEKQKIDDPVGAISVHGVAGMWGSLSTGLFATPVLVQKVGVGSAGLFYGGGWKQLGVQALGVAIATIYVALVSFIILWVIDKVMGLRVSKEEELSGLDLSEHGSYGYPEHVFLIKWNEGSGLREGFGHKEKILNRRKTSQKRDPLLVDAVD